jgi:hypothetical protein
MLRFVAVPFTLYHILSLSPAYCPPPPPPPKKKGNSQMAESVKDNQAAPIPRFIQQQFRVLSNSVESSHSNTQPFLNPIPMSRASPPSLENQSASRQARLQEERTVLSISVSAGKDGGQVPQSSLLSSLVVWSTLCCSLGSERVPQGGGGWEPVASWPNIRPDNSQLY